MNKIAAVFTAYKPDGNFLSRTEAIRSFCEILIVVDNTPGGHPFTHDERDKFHIIQDGINKGLGEALNIGIRYARSIGALAVVLFDQDSSPSSSFMDHLYASLKQTGSRSIVGPKFVDDTIQVIDDNFPAMVLEEVGCLPTSGMMFYLDSDEGSVKFSHELFLDFVDFELCWRLKSIGWNIFRIKTLPMRQRLGESQRSIFGLKYHVPHPYRHYFQFRDTLRLTSKGYVPFYSRWRLRLILIPKLFCYPFILNNGFARIKWMLLGILDWARGVRGIGSCKDILA